MLMVADIVACGHVHLQWMRRLGRTLWFCVGSAGLAHEHVDPLDEATFEPWAEYAVLTADAGRLRVEFRRVPFDIERFLRVLSDCGMPYADLRSQMAALMCLSRLSEL